MISDNDLIRMSLAHEVSENSDDPSGLKQGCVISHPSGTNVIGFNMKIPNVWTDELSGPDFIAQAEEIAIHGAVELGVNFKACTAYLTHIPSITSFRLLHMAGVVRFVCMRKDSYGNLVSIEKIVKETKVIFEYVDEEKLKNFQDSRDQQRAEGGTEGSSERPGGNGRIGIVT